MQLKVTWRGDELKMFNTVEPAHMGTRGDFFMASNWRVRYTRGARK
jgi:hypothetical protein